MSCAGCVSPPCSFCLCKFTWCRQNLGLDWEFYSLGFHPLETIFHHWLVELFISAEPLAFVKLSVQSTEWISVFVHSSDSLLMSLLTHRVICCSHQVAIAIGKMTMRLHVRSLPLYNVFLLKSHRIIYSPNEVDFVSSSLLKTICSFYAGCDSVMPKYELHF